MRRVSYRGRRTHARLWAQRVRGRGPLAASLAIVLTVLSWAVLVVPANAAGVPTNISPPTILGTPQEGQTLTEAHGSWTNSPRRYTYRWGRCNSAGSACVVVDGATSQTYTLTAADVGHAIIVREVAHNPAGASKEVSSAPTAAVSPAPAPPSSPQTNTATTLSASPAAPVANEPVTLIAAVTSTVSGVAPSGAVTFLNGSIAIPGCANEPVNPSGQSVVVTCQTWFGASAAPLTAVFSPDVAAIAGSTSATVNLAIGQDTTSTSLDASNIVGVGASTTYTATVNAAPGGTGTLQPTGTVEFLDGGRPIGACLGQPVTSGGATCTVTYNATGSHSISAQYSGDANFRASSAPGQPVSVIKPPPRTLGLIGATMQWTFDSTSTYTKVLALLVNGATSATVSASCHGHGCPFARHKTLVTKTKRCPRTPSRACPTHGTLDLAPGFRNGRLSVGARITVTITRPGWIGKYYQFTVRAGRPPRIQVACLAPGSSRPGLGC